LGDTICPGEPFQVSALGSGGTGNYTYTWSPNLGNGNAYTVYANALTTWTVNAVDANGCLSAPMMITADVYQFSPADLTVTANPSICEGASATITTSVSGNTGPLTWNWANNLVGPGPHVVYPTTNTTYSVNVTNICGVVVPFTTTIAVHPIPLVDIPSQFATGCDAVNLSFSDTSTANAGCFYAWDFGDNSTGTGSSTNHDYTVGGTYTVSVIVTSQYGCVGSNSGQVGIIVYTSPTAGFTMSDDELSIIEPMVMFTNISSSNTIGWEWDFGDTTTSTLSSPVHTYQHQGTYNVRLVATSNGGCTDTLEQPLEVNPEYTVFIPNAFTPDADGINDVFFVYGAEITTLELKIFDRWGNLVFESDDQYEGWDGRANGGTDVAQQDVYVYKVFIKDFEGKQHKYTGHVSLLK
jgi:gliding motility-associated-like protein